MAVKRFYAAKMHTALADIRTQLGDDAVILATRQLSDGVEVSAAVDTEGAISSQLPVKAGQGKTTDSNAVRAEPAVGGQGGLRRDMKQFSKTSAELRRSASVSDSGALDRQGNDWYLNSISALEDEQSALHSELGSIRSLLQCWMDNQSWENYATKSPVHAKLWERYRSLGLEGEQINELLKTVTDDQDLKRAWLLTLAQLRHQLPVVAGDLVESGGVFAFLGATGVGKTTSIGKLATRFVLNHGPDSVALVTTDRYRIAAHEQLRTLGKILGVTVQAIDDSNSLVAVLESLRSKQLVLIDTAGIHVEHKNFNEQLQILESASQTIKSVLVLSATSQIEVQRAELSAYSSLNVRAGIITKTDEAVSLGGSLGLFATNRIPVAYEAFGQSIPDDIVTADAQQLINKAVLISRHKPINREQMVAGFNTTFTNTGYKERHASSVG